MDELRRHYQRPYFLPADSESSNIDWIFMGGAGEGANIHVSQRQNWIWGGGGGGGGLPQSHGVC